MAVVEVWGLLELDFVRLILLDLAQVRSAKKLVHCDRFGAWWSGNFSVDVCLLVAWVDMNWLGSKSILRTPYGVLRSILAFPRAWLDIFSTFSAFHSASDIHGWSFGYMNWLGWMSYIDGTQAGPPGLCHLSAPSDALLNLSPIAQGQLGNLPVWRRLWRWGSAWFCLQTTHLSFHSPAHYEWMKPTTRGIWNDAGGTDSLKATINVIWTVVPLHASSMPVSQAGATRWQSWFIPRLKPGLGPTIRIVTNKKHTCVHLNWSESYSSCLTELRISWHGCSDRVTWCPPQAGN